MDGVSPVQQLGAGRSAGQTQCGPPSPPLLPPPAMLFHCSLASLSRLTPEQGSGCLPDLKLGSSSVQPTAPRNISAGVSGPQSQPPNTDHRPLPSDLLRSPASHLPSLPGHQTQKAEHFTGSSPSPGTPRSAAMVPAFTGHCLLSILLPALNQVTVFHPDDHKLLVPKAPNITWLSPPTPPNSQLCFALHAHPTPPL